MTLICSWIRRDLAKNQTKDSIPSEQGRFFFFFIFFLSFKKISFTKLKIEVL